MAVAACGWWEVVIGRLYHDLCIDTILVPLSSTSNRHQLTILANTHGHIYIYIPVRFVCCSRFHGLWVPKSIQQNWWLTMPSSWPFGDLMFHRRNYVTAVMKFLFHKLRTSTGRLNKTLISCVFACWVDISDLPYLVALVASSLISRQITSLYPWTIVSLATCCSSTFPSFLYSLHTLAIWGLATHQSHWLMYPYSWFPLDCHHWYVFLAAKPLQSASLIPITQPWTGLISNLPSIMHQLVQFIDVSWSCVLNDVVSIWTIPQILMWVFATDQIGYTGTLPITALQ